MENLSCGCGGPADLGATLCAIADLDPAEPVPAGRVIRSLVSGS